MSLNVAPMMAWTDRHCRYLHRLCAPQARLFTEMIATGALINGPREALLACNPAAQPVAIQLGGADPQQMAIVGGVFVIGLVFYFVMKQIRRSQGVDVTLAFKEIPIE